MSEIIKRLHELQALLAFAQEDMSIGTPEWHRMESIDDSIFDALTVAELDDLSNVVANSVSNIIKDRIKEKLMKMAEEVVEEVATDLAKDIVANLSHMRMYQDNKIQLHLVVGPKKKEKNFVVEKIVKEVK